MLHPLPRLERSSPVRIWLCLLATIYAAPAEIHAQHALPVPGCPGRGLSAPGSEPAPFINRGYGCALSGCESDHEEDPEKRSLFLLPESFHYYEGITGELIYTGEVFTNARGGINTNGATRYRGNIDLVVNVDTTAMDLWEGGRFFIYGSQFHGRTLTPQDVGDTQFYSNIEGAPRPDSAFQVTEFWYEHSLADDGALRMKIGKQDANADFAYVDLGGDFVNSSFGLNPTVPLPTWPNPGMGASLFWDATDLIHLQTGVYDGSTAFGVQTGGRWGLSNPGELGVMTLYELSLTPQLGAEQELPGTWKAGAWYHSGNFDNLSTGVGTVSGNHGFYFSADQLLWLEPGSEETPQGFGAFVQWGFSPSDRSAIDQYFGTGVTYRGLISGRDEDLTGLGLARAHFADTSLNQESAVELFYKAQINEYWVLQPDVQYLANPSGTFADALVLGLRTEIAL